MKANPWRRLSSSVVFETPIFSIRKVRSRSPQRELERDFVVLESSDWVNVIAITEEEKVVLIRQFRHGTQEITVEIPGGVVEPGETPLQAAQRELQEETGYQSDHWQFIGVVEPNPAFQVNRTHSFLARGARLVSEPKPDETEEIEVEEEPLGEIPGLITAGTIKHSLVLCAFLHLWLAGEYPLPVFGKSDRIPKEDR